MQKICSFKKTLEIRLRENEENVNKHLATIRRFNGNGQFIGQQWIIL